MRASAMQKQTGLKVGDTLIFIKVSHAVRALLSFPNLSRRSVTQTDFCFLLPCFSVRFCAILRVFARWTRRELTCFNVN
ncbi:MAG: hypothetical protein ACLQSR_18320 [Limisphaerales bacterium]